MNLIKCYCLIPSILLRVWGTQSCCSEECQPEDGRDALFALTRYNRPDIVVTFWMPFTAGSCFADKFAI